MPDTDADEAGIRHWCRAYLARVLRRPEDAIGDEAEFASLGLDSAESLFMVSALEERFGLDLASDTTVEFPTVARLAGFVAGMIAGGRR